MKWHAALSEPLTSHIYVDSDIEDEARQAMLKSMAILRGETDKIDLSLNKYTEDLTAATTAPSATAPGVGAHPVTAAQKYDAFKHRNFIYDDEEDLPDVLSPGLLAMGGAPLPNKNRSNSVDSDNLEFERTAKDMAASIEEEDRSFEEGDEEGEEVAGDFAADDDESAHEFDPEESLTNQEQEDDSQRDDDDNTFVPSTSSQDINDDGTPLKTPLYHLAGGVKPRPHTTNQARTQGTSSATSASVPEVPSYKANSHTRYQKGGDSWIKKDSPGGANLSALPKTPARSPKPKQLIPTSDVKQPLARRHSSMINQCKAPMCSHKCFFSSLHLTLHTSACSIK